MRFFYLLCALIMLAVLFWLAPKGLRPVVAIAFLTNYILWHMVAGGLIDTLWVLLVFVGWISRRNPWLSALLMGLAAATKQMAWFFILFYLILSLRESGWKGTLRSLGVIAVTFTVVNVPFIFLAPHSWLEGVLAPILDPMFGQGDGIVALTIIGVLPPNQLAFTLIEAAVLLLALVWYYYNWREYPQAGLLLPVLPLFFAWRSLPHNFFFASLLVFGAVVIREYSGAKASAKPQLSPSTQLGGKPL